MVDVGDIEDAPAVDAVPVVRCKDCKVCRGFPGPDIEQNELGLCKWSGTLMKPDDFCSYGERRADNGKAN